MKQLILIWNNPLLFFSIVLFSAANLAISITVAKDMSSSVIDMCILIAIALAAELAKICAMSFTYTLSKAKDLRAILAVTVVLITSAISITTVAGFFSNKYADQKAYENSLTKEAQILHDHRVNHEAKMADIERVRQAKISVIKSRISAKMDEINDYSNTTANYQKYGKVTQSTSYLNHNDGLRNQLDELNRKLLELLGTDKRTAYALPVHTLENDGLLTGPLSSPHRSGPQSIRLPAFLAGKDHWFFLFGVFIDVTLMCLVVLTPSNVSKPARTVEKTTRTMDRELSEADCLPVHTNTKLTVVKNNKPNTLVPVKTPPEKPTKTDEIAAFIISKNNGENVSINEIKTRFKCGHRLAKPIFESLVSDGFLTKQGTAYIRKTPIKMVKSNK